jgi:hypothetical protein
MGGQIYHCVDGSYVALCRNNINGTFTGADALLYFNAGLGIGYDFLVLFCMFIGFRLSAYLALRFIKDSVGRT